MPIWQIDIIRVEVSTAHFVSIRVFCIFHKTIRRATEHIWHIYIPSFLGIAKVPKKVEVTPVVDSIGGVLCELVGNMDCLSEEYISSPSIKELVNMIIK